MTKRKTTTTTRSPGKLAIALMGPKRIVSADGGVREECGARFDLIPFAGVKWVARVFHYGNVKYPDPPENWKGLNTDSEQSPVSHGIGHAMEAMDYPKGSIERKWNLAKAAWNMLTAIWHEEKIAPVSDEEWREFYDSLLSSQGSSLG